MQPFDQDHEARIYEFPTPQHPSWVHDDDYDFQTWSGMDVTKAEPYSVGSFLTDLVGAMVILGLFFTLLWVGTALT